MHEELILTHEECAYCPKAEMCSRYVRERGEDECSEILCSMIEEMREEYEEAWRIYISEYED